MKKVITLLILLVVSGIYIYVTADMEITESKVSYAYDVYNKDLRVQNATHIFIGKVIKMNGYRYTKYDMPITEYEVEVLESLKGDFKLSTIKVFKDAGKVKWKRTLEIPEDDFFPEEGNTYIFLGKLSEDDDFDIYSGFINISGAQSNILLGDISLPEIKELDIYQLYLKIIDKYKDVN